MRDKYIFVAEFADGIVTRTPVRKRHDDAPSETLERGKLFAGCAYKRRTGKTAPPIVRAYVVSGPKSQHTTFKAYSAAELVDDVKEPVSAADLVDNVKEPVDPAIISLAASILSDADAQFTDICISRSKRLGLDLPADLVLTAIKLLQAYGYRVSKPRAKKIVNGQPVFDALFQPTLNAVGKPISPSFDPNYRPTHKPPRLPRRRFRLRKRDLRNIRFEQGR
jgi:hypothetical protein